MLKKEKKTPKKEKRKKREEVDDERKESDRSLFLFQKNIYIYISPQFYIPKLSGAGSM